MSNSNNLRFQLTFWQKIIGVIAVGTAILKHISRFYPTLVEDLYTNGLYDFIRFLFDSLLGWIPFPIIYILVIVLIFVVAKRFKTWHKKK